MGSRGTRRLTGLTILVGLVTGLLVATLTAAPLIERRTIYVTALDVNGRPVPLLNADDFRVKEDGRVKKVVQAQPATEVMHIALLLDDGGPSLAAMRQATGQFVERLQRKAEFSLTTTAGQPQARVRLTADPREIYNGLLGTFANSAPTTQFLDALLESVRNHISRKAVRPVIVAIVSEGEQLSSLRATVVLDALQQSGAMFYYIGLGMPVTTGTRPPPGSFRAADSTESEAVQRNTVVGSGPKNSGGRSEQVLLPNGIEPLMLSFAAELAGQYAVTYETYANRARLEVTTSRPGVRLRAPLRVGGK